MVSFAFLGLFATILCFPSVTKAAGGYWAIVVMDALVLTSGFAVNGIAFGFAGKYCDPKSTGLRSVAGFWLVSTAFHTIGRCGGPVIARAALSSGNRVLYAGLQLSTAALGTLTTWKLRNGLRKDFGERFFDVRHEFDDDESSPLLSDTCTTHVSVN